MNDLNWANNRGSSFGRRFVPIRARFQMFSTMYLLNSCFFALKGAILHNHEIFIRKPNVGMFQLFVHFDTSNIGNFWINIEWNVIFKTETWIGDYLTD